MLRRVFSLISVLFVLSAFPKQADLKKPITVKLKDGHLYRVSEVKVVSSAEKNRIWYTDSDGFYTDVSFDQLIEIRNTEKGIILTKVRTGTERVKKMDNYRFSFSDGRGRILNIPFSEIEYIRFETHKCDKICPLGHIFRDTDFIYCPYDGLMLSPLQTENVETVE